MNHLIRAFASCAVVCLGWCAAVAQTGPSSKPEILGGWATDRVRLTDGTELEGLIESEDDAWLNFAEIRRPPGKPMYLVIRPLDRASVASLVRPEAAQRTDLRRRIDQFVRRASIEAGKMEAVRLITSQGDGRDRHSYRGKWFALESTADPDTTRQIILRVEQLFTAYRQVLPPRIERSRPLRLLVFGSLEEYGGRLQQAGLKITNPAVFLPEPNIVLAGSELGRYREEVAEVQTEHQALRVELRRLEEQLRTRLIEVGRQLQAQGVSRDAIRDLLAREKRKADHEIKQKQAQIRLCDRKNEEAFQRVAGQMLARMGHESFHAYLENWCYPRGKYLVPRWLNEGLAMMFESGQLDAGTLRLDAPHRGALRQLKGDLAGDSPTELAAFLAADARAFLVPHAGAAGASQRSYSYAWGLAHYLALEKRLLGSPALDEYVARESEATSPTERFEQLVGTKLPEFERAWHAYIRGLR